MNDSPILIYRKVIGSSFEGGLLERLSMTKGVTLLGGPIWQRIHNSTERQSEEAVNDVRKWSDSEGSDLQIHPFFLNEYFDHIPLGFEKDQL